MRNILKKFFQNEYIFSVFARLLTVGIGVLHSIAFARFLGPELKGMAATVQSYSGILSIVLTFGMQEAYPYYKRHYNKSNFKDRFLTLNVALFVVYELVATVFVIATSSLWSTMGMTAVISPCSAFSTVVAYVLLIEKPIKQNKTLIVISFAETTLSFMLLVSTTANVVWLLILLSFTFVAKAIYCTFALKFKYDRKGLEIYFLFSMLKFGFWPMIGLLLTGLNYKIDVIMLSAYKSISLADIGIYSIGVSLADKTVYIPDAVREILLSKLAKGADESEVARAIRMCLPISLGIVFFLIALGKPIIGILYGESYLDSYNITVICVFGTAIMVIFKMISQWNIVHNKQRLNTVMLAISVLVNIVANMFVIPRYGIIGAAYASVFGYFVCAIIFLLYFSSKTKISLRNILLITRDDVDMLKRMH